MAEHSDLYRNTYSQFNEHVLEIIRKETFGVALDAADQLRLEQMLAEQAWAAFHIWDRTQRGIFPKGTFEATGGALLCGLLKTAGGGAWWGTAQKIGFPPGVVSDVDAVLARNGAEAVSGNSMKESPKT